MSKITFISTEEVFDVPDGIDLLKAYQINPKLPLKFGCTQGTCGVCAIHLASGEKHLSKTTKQEIITLKERSQPGYRLACQCAINGDIKIS